MMTCARRSVRSACACALLLACSSSAPTPDEPGASGSGGSPVVGGGSAGQPSTGGQGAFAGAGLGGNSTSAGAAGISSGGSPPAAGAGGSGGASAGAGGSAGSGIAGFGGAPEDKPDTIEVGVRNLCPFPLWIHASGSGVTLEPDDAMLASAEIRWYDAPKTWSAARLTAYDGGPRTGELEKAEMTFVEAGDGVVLNYNVTYVDWLGLPLEIESEGGGSDCKTAGCYVPQAQVLTGCPDDLLSGNRCLAARTYCMNGANQGGEFCHRLDSEIAYCASSQAECAGASGASTGDAYSCAGFFAGTPRWCAALNRGMVDDPD